MLFTCLDLHERARTDTRFHARRVEAGAMNATTYDTALRVQPAVEQEDSLGFWPRREGFGGWLVGGGTRLGALRVKKVEG